MPNPFNLLSKLLLNPLSKLRSLLPGRPDPTKLSEQERVYWSGYDRGWLDAGGNPDAPGRSVQP